MSGDPAPTPLVTVLNVETDLRAGCAIVHAHKSRKTMKQPRLWTPCQSGIFFNKAKQVKIIRAQSTSLGMEVYYTMQIMLL